MVIPWISRHHKKIQEIGLGLFLWEAFNFAFDFIFYPLALAFWGIADGGGIAIAASLIINFAVFFLYEYLEIDWLGAHALQELADKENKSNIEKMMTWIHKKKTTVWEKLASPIVFVTLTLPIDPLIVAIHHRKQHFHGITLHDIGLLLAATLAANAWWLLKVGLIVEIATIIWHSIISFI